MLHLDAKQASRFVGVLTGDRNTVLTVQTFDDTPAKRRDLAAIRAGTLEQLWPWIVAQQTRGAGVFVTVNATEPGKRTAADVTKVRALFCDFDGVEPPAVWHWAPSIVVQSGHGKHAYWRVSSMSEIPLDQFKPAQLRLSAHYRSDAKVHDLSRVMRLPGTLHQKDSEPKLVTLDEYNGLAYAWPSILDRVPELPEPPMKPREPERRHLSAEQGAMPYLNLATFDVRRYFEDAGLLLIESKQSGKWYVHCPWSAQHTGGKVTATSTAIYEATAGRAAGFWCSHNACDSRTIRDVRAEMSDAELSRYCERWEGRRATKAANEAARAEENLPWKR